MWARSCDDVLLKLIICRLRGLWLKEWSICTWWRNLRKANLSTSIWHWMSKVIKGYIWKMRMLLQKARRKAKRSSLAFLGDRKSKLGIMFNRLILEVGNQWLWCHWLLRRLDTTIKLHRKSFQKCIPIHLTINLRQTNIYLLLILLCSNSISKFQINNAVQHSFLASSRNSIVHRSIYWRGIKLGNAEKILLAHLLANQILVRRKGQSFCIQNSSKLLTSSYCQC